MCFLSTMFIFIELVPFECNLCRWEDRFELRHLEGNFWQHLHLWHSVGPSPFHRPCKERDSEWLFCFEVMNLPSSRRVLRWAIEQKVEANQEDEEFHWNVFVIDFSFKNKINLLEVSTTCCWIKKTCFYFLIRTNKKDLFFRVRDGSGS